MVNSQLNILIWNVQCACFFGHIFSMQSEKLFIHTKLIKHCKIAFYALLHEVECYSS